MRTYVLGLFCVGIGDGVRLWAGFIACKWRNFSNYTQFKINPLSRRPGVLTLSLCQFSVGFHVINVAMYVIK